MILPNTTSVTLRQSTKMSKKTSSECRVYAQTTGVLSASTAQKIMIKITTKTFCGEKKKEKEKKRISVILMYFLHQHDMFR